jgi:hypothetical protein
VKKYCLGFASILFLFLFVQPSYAARNVVIESNKSALFGEEEMTVHIASMSGFITGETIYFKGAFYQEGSTNYLGYTKIGDTWIKNGESTINQKKIKIGDWDGNLAVKTDFSDSGYIGEGSYKFKLGFYYLTSGGNLSSINWSSNNLDVNISEPDPTVTPRQIPTDKPEPTLKGATPTSKSYITPTVSPTKKLSLIDKKVASLAALKDVLGTKSAEKKTLTPTPTIKLNNTKNVLIKSATVGNISAIFIVVGGLMVMGCGILVFLRKTKDSR